MVQIIQPKHIQSVTALVINDTSNAMLMVRQPIHAEHNTNGLTRSDAFWLPPGCTIRDDDTMRRALSQKIEEESGIGICDAEHLYTSTCFMTDGQLRQTVSGFLCSVKSDMPRPKAADIYAPTICWMPLAVAMRHIARMPDIGYREPLLNYLANGKTISYWSYGTLNNGQSIRSFPQDKDLHGKTNLIP